MELNDKIIKAMENFPNKKILVVGDFILDKFVRGTVSRISPEAPVPIVNINEEQYLPGGAGNVASNLLRLGAKVSVAGVLGDDSFGKKLKTILRGMKVEVEGLFVDKNRPTSLKTRIIAAHQQVVRADLESKKEISGEVLQKVIECIKKCIKDVDGIVVSDYGKGLITSELIKQIRQSALQRNIPVVVDPQTGHFFEYKNVTSVTPNVHEAGAAFKIVIEDEASLLEVGKRMLETLESESVLITRGEQGMTLFLKDGEVKHIPTAAKEVFDVTGAGDTVSTVLTLALTSGLDLYHAAVLSNYAAAVVVGKNETATASIDEIIREINK